MTTLGLILAVCALCWTRCVLFVTSCDNVTMLNDCPHTQELLWNMSYRIRVPSQCQCFITGLQFGVTGEWDGKKCHKLRCTIGECYTILSNRRDFAIARSDVPIEISYTGGPGCRADRRADVQICLDYNSIAEETGTLECSGSGIGPVSTDGTTDVVVTGTEAVTSDATTPSASQSGLSKDVILGVSLGAGFLVVLGIGFLTGFLCRRRNKSKREPASVMNNPTYSLEMDPSATIGHKPEPPYELQGEINNYAYLDISNISLDHKVDQVPPEPPERPDTLQPPGTGQGTHSAPGVVATEEYETISRYKPEEKPPEENPTKREVGKNEVEIHGRSTVEAKPKVNTYAKVVPGHLRRPESDLVVVDNVTYQDIDGLSVRQPGSESLGKSESDVKSPGTDLMHDTQQSVVEQSDNNSCDQNEVHKPVGTERSDDLGEVEESVEKVVMTGEKKQTEFPSSHTQQTLFHKEPVYSEPVS